MGMELSEVVKCFYRKNLDFFVIWWCWNITKLNSLKCLEALFTSTQIFFLRHVVICKQNNIIKLMYLITKLTPLLYSLKLSLFRNFFVCKIAS